MRLLASQRHASWRHCTLASIGLDGYSSACSIPPVNYKEQHRPSPPHPINRRLIQGRAAGIADKFYAFTENISRKNILDKADHIAPSLDEFLYKENLPMAISYPKNRIKVLLLEGIHEDAVAHLKKEG